MDQDSIGLVDRWEALRSTTLRVSCYSSTAGGFKVLQMSQAPLDDFTISLKALDETNNASDILSEAADSLARVLGLSSKSPRESGDVAVYKAEELVLSIEVGTPCLR